MKNIKLFEEFGESSFPDLNSTLKTICDLYEEECNGVTIHPSEYFDDGDELRELVNGKGGWYIKDKRIKSILNNIADCCLAECDGSAEHLCDWMSDDDCNYICDYIQIDRKF